MIRWDLELKISQIEWDTDGEDIEDLPTETEWCCDWVEYPPFEDEICDHLESVYDCSVKSYCIEKVERYEHKVVGLVKVER